MKIFKFSNNLSTNKFSHYHRDPAILSLSSNTHLQHSTNLGQRVGLNMRLVKKSSTLCMLDRIRDKPQLLQ